jgi:hypothetical protein
MKEIIKLGDLMDIFSPFEFGIREYFPRQILESQEVFIVRYSFLDGNKILIINNN